VPVNDGDEFEIAEGTLIDLLFLFSYNSLCSPGMRVKWAKTHARANRWQEEVILLMEEMRHVVVYLDWKALWWRTQVLAEMMYELILWMDSEHMHIGRRTSCTDWLKVLLRCGTLYSRRRV